MDIHAKIAISIDEFRAYVDAVGAYRAIVERPAYELLHRNWYRLTSMRDMYENLERVSGQFRLVEKRSLVVGLMGELANWLAATRLYLESQRDMISNSRES